MSDSPALDCNLREMQAMGFFFSRKCTAVSIYGFKNKQKQPVGGGGVFLASTFGGSSKEYLLEKKNQWRTTFPGCE